MQATQVEAGLWAAFGQSNLAGQGIVVILGALSLLAWTIMVFKYLDLRALRRQNKDVHAAFKSALTTGRWRGLGTAQSPYAHLLEAVMPLNKKHYESPTARIRELENKLEASLGIETLRYESQMSLLSTLTTGAPLLGLLGTVWGVMEAFGSVAHEQHVTLQSLAPGVSGALLTTVAGLLVALPCVFGYNTLVAHVRRMTIELEAFASEIHTAFSESDLESTVQAQDPQQKASAEPILA